MTKKELMEHIKSLEEQFEELRAEAIEKLKNATLYSSDFYSDQIEKMKELKTEADALEWVYRRLDD